MRLVNADKYLKETCTYKDTGCGSCIFQGKCIADEPTVLELPDNPTNGDMISALFKTEIEFEDKKLGVITVKYDGHHKTYDYDWWYKPYKKEIEE